MKAHTVKKVVVKVVNETVPNPKEFIKSLLLRAVFPMCPKVPFTKKGCLVSCPLQDLRHGELVQSHIDSLG